MCCSMHGAFSELVLHASVCRNQALHPGTVLVVSGGLGVRCLVVPGCSRASEAQSVDPAQTLDLLSVLGEPLRHSGTRRDFKFQASDGSEVRVNFGETDATRPILSVKKGADSGATTIFKPDG